MKCIYFSLVILASSFVAPAIAQTQPFTQTPLTYEAPERKSPLYLRNAGPQLKANITAPTRSKQELIDLLEEQNKNLRVASQEFTTSLERAKNKDYNLPRHDIAYLQRANANIERISAIIKRAVQELYPFATSE